MPSLLSTHLLFSILSISLPLYHLFAIPFSSQGSIQLTQVFSLLSYPLYTFHSQSITVLSIGDESIDIHIFYNWMLPRCSSSPRSNRIRIAIICWIIMISFFLFTVKDITSKFSNFPKIDGFPLIRIGRSVNNRTIIDTIDISCDDAINGNKSAISKLKEFKYDWREIHDRIVESDDRCGIYRSEFGFNKSKSREEEIEFPLAFAILAHNRLEQLLLMLSSVYESHNLFCIAIPSNSDQLFIHLVHGLPDCFDNIHIIQSGPISWGSYAIMRVTYDCMELLVKEKKEWKYFQYLSGVDASLRTNLEMVQIMKEWKGLSHVLTLPFQEGRLGMKKNKTLPMKLFKTSLSGIISREAATVMIKNKKARELIEFLRETRIADESFWASAIGNPDVIQMNGSFNATEFLSFTNRYSQAKKKGKGVKPVKCIYSPCLTRGFVGRYQTWVRKKCKGSWSNGSCVYGVEDLSSLLSNGAFVAHKLYIEYQPAAFICILKKLNSRRSNPDENFNYSQYNNLPQIEFMRGTKYENLTRYDLIL